MKNLLIPLFVGLTCCCLKIPAVAQYNEIIQKEFVLQNDAAISTLFIYNIFGSIIIEGYSGNKVVFEAHETISADDNKTLEIVKKEFKLGFEQKTDSIIAYIAAPFDSRPNQCRNNNVDIDYEYKVDFTVKVPYNMNLQVSTVNDGVMTIKDVSGNLRVNNVNEGITIVNAKGTTKAHTVNGDIKINYLNNPSEQCSYYTINGDIDVTYQTDLSADLRFKSMNGEFYTNFSGIDVIPVAVTQKQDNKNGKNVYKLSKMNTIRYGKGGKIFKFETLNGNVYIKKQS